ncbi:MAG: radical SAM protein [Candidatus Woesearchaeota archaeon]
MDKKIILINTWMPSDLDLDPLPPHLGLLAISTYIHNQGYSPKIFDTRPYFKQSKDYWADLNSLLEGALCVGLSVMTAQVNSALEISKKIRENYPNLPIVWGGYHPSLYPMQTLEDPLVDFITQGEGDWSFLELIDSLKNNKSYDKIDGLGYKRKGQSFFNPQSKYYEIDTLPAWDWSFYDVSSFISGRTWSDPKEVKQLPIQTSRGCPYGCTFCINTTLSCYRKWRARSIPQVISEIKNLISKYGIEWISFRDEIFFMTKKRIIEFCDALMANNIKLNWAINARCDFFTNGVIDDDVLRKLKMAGCVNLCFGAESGSQKILNFLRKGIMPHQIVLSAKKSHQFGLKPVYSFIAGLPGETKSDIMMTFTLMKKIMESCPEAVLLGPHLYRPYPGCELYDIAKKFGVPEAKTLREWPKIINESFSESFDPIERGGYGFKSLPWIYDPKFVNAFITYARYAAYNPWILFKTRRYHMCLLSIISKIRFKLGFYSLVGIERKIRDIFH